jgi:hypothetical protein
LVDGCLGVGWLFCGGCCKSFIQRAYLHATSSVLMHLWAKLIAIYMIVQHARCVLIGDGRQVSKCAQLPIPPVPGLYRPVRIGTAPKKLAGPVQAGTGPSVPARTPAKHYLAAFYAADGMGSRTVRTAKFENCTVDRNRLHEPV